MKTGVKVALIAGVLIVISAGVYAMTPKGKKMLGLSKGTGGDDAVIDEAGSTTVSETPKSEPTVVEVGKSGLPIVDKVSIKAFDMGTLTSGQVPAGAIMINAEGKRVRKGINRNNWSPAYRMGMKW